MFLSVGSYHTYLTVFVENGHKLLLTLLMVLEEELCLMDCKSYCHKMLYEKVANLMDDLRHLTVTSKPFLSP